MENEKKKRAPIISILCWIIGFCLIVTGIIIPQIKNQQEKYTFSVDSDGFGTYYEFEIEMNESINPDAAYAKIKVRGVKTETFKLEYDIGESEYGEYVFTLELSGDNRSMFNEVVEVEVTTTSGKILKLQNEDNFDEFKDNSSVVMMVVLPTFFGIFFIMVGFAFFIARKHSKHIKRANEKIMDVVFKEDSEEQKVQVTVKKENTITCKYCKIENSPENAKCEHCGAPLIRNKN